MCSRVTTFPKGYSTYKYIGEGGGVEWNLNRSLLGRG